MMIKAIDGHHFGINFYATKHVETGQFVAHS